MGRLVSTTCLKCKNYFEYEQLRPNCPRKVCDDCQKGVRKKWLKIQPISASEEGGLPGRYSHKQIADLLGVGRETIIQAERRALEKIRANQQLRELFDIWIRDGAPTVESALNAPKTQVANKLLKYQLEVTEWWAIHDELIEKARDNAEAAECLGLIEQMQQKIMVIIDKL